MGLETCEYFTDSCGKNYTPEQLFQLLIGKDANGCPVLKTQEQSNLNSVLTPETFQAADMNALNNAISTYMAANPNQRLVSQSLSFNSVDNEPIALIFFRTTQ